MRMNILGLAAGVNVHPGEKEVNLDVGRFDRRLNHARALASIDFAKSARMVTRLCLFRISSAHQFAVFVDRIFTFEYLDHTGRRS